MFWALPQALKGRSSIAEAFFGVLLLGSVLLGFVLALPLYLIVSPERSEVAFHAAWAGHSVYVIAAAVALWRCSSNTRFLLAKVLSRVAAATYFACPFILFAMQFTRLAQSH